MVKWIKIILIIAKFEICKLSRFKKTCQLKLVNMPIYQLWENLQIKLIKLPISQFWEKVFVERPALQWSATTGMVARTLPANIESSETLKPFKKTLKLSQL